MFLRDSFFLLGIYTDYKQVFGHTPFFLVKTRFNKIILLVNHATIARKKVLMNLQMRPLNVYRKKWKANHVYM
jgi:hypothetical protein